MKALEQRIRRDGRILPGAIIQVDSFLNHQVDTLFLAELADEFGRHFDVRRATKILTVEASGIALATICSYKFGIPMLFAKKAKQDNIEGGLDLQDVYACSSSRETLLCAKRWLTKQDRVLILDDFLANGETMQGLLNIVEQAGAELIGIGCVIEKGFQHGGDRLREAGYPLRSLAIIDRADESGYVFRQQ